MGSQRGSASGTAGQKTKTAKSFKNQAKKQAGSSSAGGSAASGSGSSAIRGRSRRPAGGSSGIGGGGGGGASFGIPGGPGERKPRPGGGGPPSGPAIGRCRHRGCKCDVTLPASYCRKYCEEAAVSGSKEPCRCGHDACP